MADNVAKINLPDDSEQAAANDDMEYGDQAQKPIGGDAANDNIESDELKINEVQGAAKKIGDDKIELTNKLKVEDSDQGKAALFNAAIAGGAGLIANAANDNVETTKTPKTETQTEQEDEEATSQELEQEEQAGDETKETTPTAPSAQKPQTSKTPPKISDQPQQEQPASEENPSEETSAEEQDADRMEQAQVAGEKGRSIAKNKELRETGQKKQKPKSNKQKQPPAAKRTPKSKKTLRPSETLGDIGPRSQSGTRGRQQQKNPPQTTNPSQTKTDLDSRKAQALPPATTPRSTPPTGAPITLPPGQQNNAASDIDAAKQQQISFAEAEKIQQQQYSELSKKQKKNEAKQKKKLLKQMDQINENLISYTERMELGLWFPTVVTMVMLAQIEIGESIKLAQKIKKTRAGYNAIATKALTLSTGLDPIIGIGFLVDTWGKFSEFWLSWSVEIWWWTVIMAIFDLIIILPAFLIMFYVFRGHRIRIMIKIKKRADKILELGNQLNDITMKSQKEAYAIFAGQQAKSSPPSPTNQTKTPPKAPTAANDNVEEQFQPSQLAA